MWARYVGDGDFNVSTPAVSDTESRTVHDRGSMARRAVRCRALRGGSEWCWWRWETTRLPLRGARHSRRRGLAA